MEGRMGETDGTPARRRARRGSRQNAEIATLAGLLGGLMATLVRRGAFGREDIAALLARERRDLLPLHQPHAGRMVDVVEFLTLLALARSDATDETAGDAPAAPRAAVAVLHERSNP
jgi:hypothetical protein